MTPSAQPPAGTSSEEDKKALHHFGYAQQLLRDMGGFSNFAISFSIISILTGAVTLYGTGLQRGGPAVMGIGWPLVTFFVLFVAASMAELASAIPTSGALYHWAALLGGARWGWATGWLNLVGLVATIAGIDYGCSLFLTPLLGMAATTQNNMIVFAVILLTQALLNHVGIRAVARLNDLSAVYHIGGVALIVGGLAFFATKHPISYLYTVPFTFQDMTGHPYWYVFMSGLLLAQWTYTGYDASAHTIEETRDARVRAPWGIFLSVAVSGFFGYLLIAFVTLAIKDLPATAAAENPFRYVFDQAFPNSSFPLVVMWVVTLAQWFCGLACVTSTSRMMFALSRDKGMPLSHLWSSVSHRFRTPAAAVWLSASLAFLLPCLLVAILAARHKMEDFSTLYTAVTGISTIGLYLSYGIPLLLKLRATQQGIWGPRTNGPWNLGSWSVPVNLIAVLWIAFITVLFVLPPNELTGYIFGGTLIALLTYYLIAVRGKFRGPIPQAISEAELLRIESQYETSGPA